MILFRISFFLNNLTWGRPRGELLSRAVISGKIFLCFENGDLLYLKEKLYLTWGFLLLSRLAQGSRFPYSKSYFF